jgi:hypothetical protein
MKVTLLAESFKPFNALQQSPNLSLVGAPTLSYLSIYFIILYFAFIIMITLISVSFKFNKILHHTQNWQCRKNIIFK